MDLIDDVVYPQLRKSLTSVTSLLEREEFEIEKTSIQVDDLTHLVVEVNSMTLPKSKKHRGPPANSENVNEFLAKWNSAGKSAPYVEDGRWYVMIERKYERADELVRAKLDDIPLGKDVKKVGKFNVLSGSEVLAKEHLAALTKHFDERMPWQR